MSKFRAKIQWAGLFLGPLSGLIVFALLPTEYPDAESGVVEFTRAGRIVLGGMIWMAIWWLTEAIEVTTTALLPLVVFPLFGAATMKEAAARASQSMGEGVPNCARRGRDGGKADTKRLFVSTCATFHGWAPLIVDGQLSITLRSDADFGALGNRVTDVIYRG